MPILKKDGQSVSLHLVNLLASLLANLRANLLVNLLANLLACLLANLLASPLVNPLANPQEDPPANLLVSPHPHHQVSLVATLPQSLPTSKTNIKRCGIVDVSAMESSVLRAKMA